MSKACYVAIMLWTAHFFSTFFLAGRVAWLRLDVRGDALLNICV
jgi:hypothetical protein